MSLNVITVYFWILQLIFFVSFFSHLSFSTTLQFVLHNSVGWGCVCVFYCDFFFVKCVRMLQNIRMKVSLTNPIPKWRGENNTYTLSRNVKKSKFVFVCDFTLQCDISTKQTDVFLSIFLLLSKIAFRVLPRDQNFFYITFFVVNATVVLFFYVLLHAYLFLSRCFWIFKFPIRSQKLICLMCVWLVFVPLKLLRLFTEKKKTECFDFSQCRTPFGLTLDAVQILTVLASVSNQWDFTGVPHVFFYRFPCVSVSVCCLSRTTLFLLMV